AQGRPLLLRLTPGAGEGALHAVGHARRAGGDGAGPGRLRLIRRAGSEVEESAAVAEQAAVEEPPAVAAIAAVATHEAAVEEAVAAVTAAHVGAALADPGREILTGVADARHAGEHHVEHHHRAHHPHTRVQGGGPPGLRIPPRRDRASGHDAARVVVAVLVAGLGGGAERAALEVDGPVLGHLPGPVLAAGLGQLRPRIHAHGLTGGTHVVQALESGVLGQAGLDRGAGVLAFGGGRGVPLGGVGHGLLGGLSGALEVERLPAQALNPACGLGAVVLDLVHLTRFELGPTVALAARDDRDGHRDHSGDEEEFHGLA